VMPILSEKLSDGGPFSLRPTLKTNRQSSTMREQ
jgi:hypothetical protein